MVKIVTSTCNGMVIGSNPIVWDDLHIAQW